ncbi:MAG: bifunctional methylenetetrahydrofolate dehydrogenase/methenyltetrahydrofolate cyclohydrolase FolD [Bacillota bacterium]|jgi:methylenetetrahydrofolate dehydrogenase (NADP+)/methenyltetrahydrofolate cyclohydrolase|nr:bifunctional methylenetetrahydrofolate dehydrogenase/methenyltetrahydrofolate cyclohydrolase FolD [Bacillota bacterium]HHU43180.1 bifunctional methylenetetrahydrofolate dehydrogenase/methenyltetrahydrofolate cyclohydrolase FolD [Clostridiales bacterium]
MTIIDGKIVSEKIRQDIKKEIEKLGIQPGLAVVIVGEDPASKVYVANKIKGCQQVGIKSFSYALSESTSEEELLELIDSLNNNREVHGILVQLPLPNHLDQAKILERIEVKKDVDGFSAYQMGKLALGQPELTACTPSGVMQLLKEYGIEISGKNAVIIGRSNIVGKPMFFMLMQENSTVTVCHSRTKNIKEICQNADILVAALGRANFVTADMVKQGAVVIDVGINRVDGKLCGDVDFQAVKDKCSFITPVPGGVGPMTITMLLYNTLKAYKLYGK